MKLRANVIIWLAFFLASCGPAVIVPDVTTTNPSQLTSVSTIQPLPTSAVLAQQPASWPGLHSGWMNFSGLGQSALTDLSYDSKGNLWALRNGGVVRWDLTTSNVTTYTALDGLPENLQYLTMFQGKAWVESDDGQMATYSNGKWIVSDYWIVPTTSTVSNTGDRLWFSGWNSIQYYDGKSLSYRFDAPALPDCEENYTINESIGGSVWFLGCGQVIRYDGRNWKSYDDLQRTEQIFTLSDGTLIFQTKNTLVRFDGSRFETLLLPGQPSGYTVYGMPHLSSDGDLWFQIEDAYGYPGSIDVIHDGEVHQLPGLHSEPTADLSLILPIVKSPENAVFYSRNNNVFYLYNGNSWKALGTSNDPWSDIVSSQVIGFAPDGALWVNNRNEPERFDGKELVAPFQEQVSQDQNSQCSQNYNFIIDSKGSIWSWVPNSPLICYYDSTANRVSPYTLFFNVSQLVADNDGGAWAASNAGFVANLTPDILESGDYREINLIRIGGDTIQSPVNPDRIVVSSDGSIWILAKNNGLYRFDGKSWKFIQQESLQVANDFAIGEDGVIWVLCNSPEKYDSESLANADFHDCGLSKDLTITRDGEVWFLSDNQMDRFDGIFRFNGIRWTQYTQDQIGNFTPDKILVAPDGALWLIGRNIWARYKP